MPARVGPILVKEHQKVSTYWALVGRAVVVVLVALACSPQSVYIVGPIDGCFERPKHIDIPQDAYEYAPTSGITELRQAVANLYNEIYRQGKESKYTHENVCIVPGGRAGLTRVAAAIGDVNVGYFLPEYTAYEQMLSVFKRFVPIPTTLEEDARYHIDPDTIRKEISGRGLGVIVASNPRNPTGQVIQDEELDELVQVAKERHTTLVLDEFYSSYIYDEEPGKTVSAAQFVDDVNQDPVIVIDGLTKNFRMPGWRVCWIVGPKPVISSMESAGSFLEGGANHPLQLAAIPFLDPAKFRNEAKALQHHFKEKRDFVLNRLKEMGLHVKVPPNATFYIWLDLSHLPEPINIGLNFFEECLKEKVIVVPGIFFDVNVSLFVVCLEILRLSHTLAFFTHTHLSILAFSSSWIVWIALPSLCQTELWATLGPAQVGIG